MHRLSIVVLLVALLVAPGGSFGWGTKEHVQLTRLAAAQLIADPATPGSMRAWLRDAAPGVTDMAGERHYFMTRRMGAVPRGADGVMFWSVVPDMNALMDRPGKKAAPFDVHERLLHYVDLELFLPDAPATPPASTAPMGAARELLTTRPADGGPSALPAEPPVPARPDPARKPRVADVPRDPTDPRLAKAGLLPHRVAQCYRELVASLRAGRLVDRPGQYPRDDHAARWAGFLAHYAADNTQPHHATVDYKSRSYFPADVRSPADVHALLEYKLPDDEFEDYAAVREAYWAAFTAALAAPTDPAAGETDPFAATILTSLAAYDALPLIGAAAVAAWDANGGPENTDGRDTGRIDLPAFYNYRGTVNGEEMTVLELKARQQVTAVAAIKRLWRQAWDEANGDVR